MEANPDKQVKPYVKDNDGYKTDITGKGTKQKHNSNNQLIYS